MGKKADLSPLQEIDGYIGSAIVDSSSGMTLAMDGGGQTLNIETAAAGNTDVVAKKREVMKKLKLNDKIEDILISLHKQYHLIRLLESNDAMFVYLALDRSKANLGMARSELNQFEKGLEL
ncbi:roadblock/LC7 domain-containing protein [Natronospira sp.]|uniref:roadblock/LC7 domain-containing protein n=1 Tax=Natronospira sp. TaxID=2024970 RepID=UPI003873370D